MDEISTIDASVTVEPVQGHLIEVFTVIDELEPIYRTNLGFHDVTRPYKTSAPITPV